MHLTLHVPTSLREFSNGHSKLQIEVPQKTTVREALARLHQTHPGVVERVLDERGSVRPHVNVFVDGNNIRLGQGLQTVVEANAEIWILPAVSGG